MSCLYYRSLAGAIFTACLIALAGCSSRSNKVPITGSLTVDGEPGSLATLTFWPGDPNGEGAGTVFTDDKGNFVSGDAKTGTGFTPGEYKVTVSRFLDRHGKPAQVSGKKSEASLETPAKESIPATYRDRNNTPLSINVTHDSATFTLEVKAKK